MTASTSGPAPEPGRSLARAALALLGCRFRLHGRDPVSGLDCVGLLDAALRAIGRPAPLPTGYRLHNSGVVDPARLALLVTRLEAAPAQAAARPGDIWLTHPGPGQWHLMILAEPPDHVIEAHAGLRRVVLTPLPLAVPIVSRWRLRPISPPLS